LSRANTFTGGKHLNKPRHFCVQTKSNCEFSAQRFLSQVLHFNVYLPQIRVERRHAGRKDFVLRPFFARYLFIEDDGRGPFYFRSARDVSNVVKHGDVPVRLRSCVIDRIREMVGLVQDKPDPGVLQPGEPVRCEGWGGFDAVFHEHKNDRRAFIMVEMMGRAAKVEVALKDLERAA
jgi:transcriptional antiterminator RfaH